MESRSLLEDTDNLLRQFHEIHRILTNEPQNNHKSWIPIGTNTIYVVNV